MFIAIDQLSVSSPSSHAQLLGFIFAPNILVLISHFIEFSGRVGTFLFTIKLFSVSLKELTTY